MRVGGDIGKRLLREATCLRSFEKFLTAVPRWALIDKKEPLIAGEAIGWLYPSAVHLVTNAVSSCPQFFVCYFLASISSSPLAEAPLFLLRQSSCFLGINFNQFDGSVVPSHRLFRSLALSTMKFVSQTSLYPCSAFTYYLAIPPRKWRVRKNSPVK